MFDTNPLPIKLAQITDCQMWVQFDRDIGRFMGRITDTQQKLCAGM